MKILLLGIKPSRIKLDVILQERNCIEARLETVGKGCEIIAPSLYCCKLRAFGCGLGTMRSHPKCETLV